MKTTEEKARAYDEALERARQKIDAGLLTDDDLSYIFPQLRESEDEKIRNDIMEAVENWLSYKRVEDIRAYLEKHKEQKPAEWNEEDKKMIEYIIGSLDSLKYYIRDNISFSESIRDSILERIEREQDWLKSFRPSWRPNKEQMKALADATKRDVFPYGYRECLETLYEQLKKL